MGINSNILWASIFVEELSRQGVTYAVTCAGSRSTPLVATLVSHPNITTISQIDERSGSFLALGIAMTTQNPVVIVSTSGTAGANFHPAVIEAFMSNVPLIVITADRPHELRDSGANQTMDQIKLFGDHVNWFSDMMTPFDQDKQKLIDYLGTTAMKSVMRTQYPSPGPVHINFPFRKPLEPEYSKNSPLNPKVVIEKSSIDMSLERKFSVPESSDLPVEEMEELTDLVQKSQRIILIAGPKSSNWITDKSISKFILKTKSLVFADGLSGIRYNRVFDKIEKQIISTYDSFLQCVNIKPPDLIIQVGQMPISKYLNNFLSETESYRVIISDKNRMSDGTLRANWIINTSPSKILKKIADNLTQKTADMPWYRYIQELEHTTRGIIKQFLSSNTKFEPYVVNKIFENLTDVNLFAANSLPVRHVDEFVPDEIRNDIKIFSNRGVSGIDGTISTALGIAFASSRPTYLITGDLAFFHDMNGLLSIYRNNIDLKIVVINNSGGEIFDRLPISDFDPPYTEYFNTHHNLEFNHIASQYDISYRKITSNEIEAGIKFIKNKQSGILEIRTENRTNEKFRQLFIEKLKDELQ